MSIIITNTSSPFKISIDIVIIITTTITTSPTTTTTTTTTDNNNNSDRIKKGTTATSATITGKVAQSVIAKSMLFNITFEFTTTKYSAGRKNGHNSASSPSSIKKVYNKQ